LATLLLAGGSSSEPTIAKARLSKLVLQTSDLPNDGSRRHA
jgi:hypothetical protein